ncbi:MaoC family dehydratase [Desulfobacula toluolica]|uniref:Putative (R)-specific enoyl-CoA hydratase, MaoC like n=1 Tax=Desulfobacula toluolica (strain DSM 7467 / Tol2) TaxID=651182 RepID=K0ND63_DESTT|nr:MaoC/PaaZ C-terminal domain-containing protein [Desulfobacula toluolica]CCK78710.1 putative (R)-specific enoyl-CoA hydratase, MaoC like [Desulfobacula toluolica Tol2]
MKNNPPIIDIPLTGYETIFEIKKNPSFKSQMGFIFLKAVLISPFRTNTIADNAIMKTTRMILKNYLPDKQRIKQYRKICAFSEDNRIDIIPISYFQTLFIGLIGRFITSCFFPVNPLGLIHIFQSFEQKRAVTTNEILDLACILSGVRKTPKGIETDFTLEVMSGKTLVWQGVSTFLTKNRVNKKKPSKKKSDIFLAKKETIFVPSETGRKYAAVSGDYNPHHLHTLPAKLFGFKRAIAHGMWSLARVTASLDREFGIQDAAMIEAAFKLPIFLPATTILGYDRQNHTQGHPPIVHFELRDKHQGLPHLKGRLLYKNQG